MRRVVTRSVCLHRARIPCACNRGAKIKTIAVALPDWKAAAVEGSAERFDVPLEIEL